MLYFHDYSYSEFGGDILFLLTNKSYNRQLNLIKLFENASTPLSQTYLITQLNCSISTLTNTINHINDVCSSLQFEYREGSYSLMSKTGYQINETYTYFMHTAEEFKLFEQLFFHEEGIQYYINELFMSESNIRRMVKKMNKELKTKGLYISTNPMQLHGDERTIRLAFSSFFYEKNRSDTQQILGGNTRFYDILTEKTLLIMGSNLSMTNTLMLKYWLFVSVQRTKKKYYLIDSNTTDKTDNFAETLYKTIKADTIFQLEFTKNTGLSVTLDTISDILPHIERTFINHNQPLKKNEYYFSTYTNISLQMISDLVTQLEQGLNSYSAPTVKNESIHTLYNYCSTHYRAPSFAYDYNKAFIDLIREKNPLFEPLLKKTVTQLNYPQMLMDDLSQYNGFLEMITMLFPDFFIASSEQKPVQIFLVTDFIPSYVSFLSSRLYDEFGTTTVIINTCENVSKDTVLRSDDFSGKIILISNFYDLPINPDEYDAYIFFNSLLSAQDIVNIRTLITVDKKNWTI